MVVSNQRKNQHLLWRAGFGPAAAHMDELTTQSPADVYKQMQQEAATDFSALDVVSTDLREMMENALLNRKQLDSEERKRLQKSLRENIRDLNLAWLQEMIHSRAQLREKMAFFWHGHFACRNLNVYFQQELLQVIRANALGDFKTLLLEVSKSAAMLNFLNNNQNRKGHPNENFAREVMELFTLGRGNYTEEDVKEGARAFTGWGTNPKGEFVFRRQQHDFGTKTFLGKTCAFGGEEILDLLLAQKQTAVFISTKIYRFFVSETIDERRVQQLAEHFYQSNYSISSLMEKIFMSDWFYDSSVIGSRIKSPIELLVGIQRMIPMQLEQPDLLLLMQRMLGQVLFYPPNVAGWPGGKTWIDSSTLMMRMRIPQLISDRDELNVQPKDDDDQMMGMRTKAQEVRKQKMGKAGRPILADLDWSAYFAHFAAVPRAELSESIRSSVLQSGTGLSETLLEKYTDASSREKFISTLTLQLMSTPEYQLC